MKMISVLLGVVLAGCASRPAIIVTTETVLGVEVAQNPASQLYQARLGFARAEFGYIPLTSTNVPNVMMELKYSNLFSGGGIYQRLCVGDIAVAQPGATMLFFKDSSGNIPTNTLNTVIPLLLAPRPTSQH